MQFKKSEETVKSSFSSAADFETENPTAVQAPPPFQLKASTTPSNEKSESEKSDSGLPTQLKAGIEHLSGVSMDGVNVEYNSSAPAQLHAHAYAQGNDIKIAPGQEKHLPHEAWHVAQQRQGRVQATTQLKGQGINDDSSLEHEADVMGAKAARYVGVAAVQKKSFGNTSSGPFQLAKEVSGPAPSSSIVQRAFVGDAPVDGDVGQAGQHNLLYGLSGMRGETVKRLGINYRDNGSYTIDEMNERIGIYGNAFSMAANIKIIRRALKDPKKWKKHLNSDFDYPTKQEIRDHEDPNTDFELDRHQLWMRYLVKHRAHIGLYDLTDGKSASAVLESKMEKNQSERDGEQTTAKDISKYLDKYNKTSSEDLKTCEYMNVGGGIKAEEEHANKWLQNAFFRRTSKLGIKFTVEQMNANIYFNLAGGVKNQNGNFDNEHYKIRDLVNNGDNEGARTVTESEYRYVQKRMAKKPALYNNNVKEYSEYE